jgi:hypothetical protein
VVIIRVQVLSGHSANAISQRGLVVIRLLLEFDRNRFVLLAPVVINEGVLANLEEPCATIAAFSVSVRTDERLEHCFLSQVFCPVVILAELSGKRRHCLQLRDCFPFKY